MKVYEVILKAKTNALKRIKKEDLESIIHQEVISDLMPLGCIYFPKQPMIIDDFDFQYSTFMKKLKKCQYISVKAFQWMNFNMDIKICLDNLVKNNYVIKNNILSLKIENIDFDEEIRIVNGNHQYKEYKIRDMFYHFYYVGDKIFLHQFHFTKYPYYDLYEILDIQECPLFHVRREGYILYDIDYHHIDMNRSCYLLNYDEDIMIKSGSFICFDDEEKYFIGG